jgi:hypothetical protein
MPSKALNRRVTFSTRLCQQTRKTQPQPGTLQSSTVTWEQLQGEHKLAGVDADKSIEIQREIAECETALKQ